MIDVYESAVDRDGRFGAVFERDDDSAFFYLLDLTRDQASQIIGAFNAQTLIAEPAHTTFTIRWNSAEDAVGLFSNGQLIALFEVALAEGRCATDADKSRFAPH